MEEYTPLVFLYWKERARGWTLEQAARYSTPNASQHSALNLFIFNHCNTSGFHVMKLGQGHGYGTSATAGSYSVILSLSPWSRRKE